jgi:hypothetical protein
LGVLIDAVPSDAYSRGRDLIVAYQETRERPFSVQVYWSVALAAHGSVRSGGAVAIDAMVSIQTRQWATYPSVTVTSVLEGCTALTIGDGAHLWRPAGADWSYAEATGHGDFTRHGGMWKFENHFMERGVIRRLRVRGAILPRADDASAAESLQAALDAERPPLSA